MAKPSQALSIALVPAILICFSGCICDSIQPWLSADSIMARGLDLEGDWDILNEDYKDKYSVKLDKNKGRRTIDQQSYYIQIAPEGYKTRFNFAGVVHVVNGIKFIQVTNFTHYHDDVFSLANRPTASLWQIAYDADNIIMWAPAFSREDISTLATVQDSDDDVLFVDSTEALQAHIENWTREYSERKDEIDMILPIALTRSGTEFRMPDEMQYLVPQVYENYLKDLEN